MKTLKTLTTMVMLSLALIWTGCQKELSLSNPDQPVADKVRNGGLIEDDAVKVSNVPFIISSDLLALGVTAPGVSSSVSKGRRPKPGSIDLTPPSVGITSPTQGQTVDPAIIAVSASASDNVSVASVSLSVNGALLNTLTAAPYNFSWDATSYAGTTPTLTATAKDATGNTNSVTITVAVKTPIIILPPPTLPASYLLATPPVGNQGYEWSCVPFATAYAARSVEQYYRTNATSYSSATNIFSPEYVYNQTKFSDCGSGTAITTTLDLMKNKGVCTWQTLPYSDLNGCDASVASSFDVQAANYKISSYGKLVSTDKTGIKTMIASKHPVIVSISVDNSFINAGPGFIWKTYSGSGAAGHSVIICGYDDSKNAYKVMSSWGTSWGDAGYTWIDYDFFSTRSGYYVYVMNY